MKRCGSIFDFSPDDGGGGAPDTFLFNHHDRVTVVFLSVALSCTALIYSKFYYSYLKNQSRCFEGESSGDISLIASRQKIRSKHLYLFLLWRLLLFR
jgi:hypothetical protein